MAKVVRRVRSQSYGSLADLKKSLKKGGGNTASAKIGYIPEDPITVRFLSEPETWVGYYEHFNGPNSDQRYTPCTGGECCEDAFEGKKPGFRFLANAYIVDTSKVQALKMPKSLVDQLIIYYTKYATILDRDYELARHGSGLDTKYSAVSEDKNPINLRRFKSSMFDLEQLLEDWASDADDDDEEEEVVPRRRGKPSYKLDDEDDEDEDDDDEDDDPPPSRSRLKSGSREFTPKRRPTSSRGVEDDEDDEPPVVPPRKRAAVKPPVVPPRKRAAVKKSVPARTIAKKVAAPAKRTIRRSK